MITKKRFFVNVFLLSGGAVRKGGAKVQKTTVPQIKRELLGIG
jgi:hypothetical protein